MSPLAFVLLLGPLAFAQAPPAAETTAPPPPDALCALVASLEPDVVRRYRDFADLDVGPRGWATRLSLPPGACSVEARSDRGRCVLATDPVPALRDVAWSWAERLQACAATPADASRFPMDPFSFPDPTGKALVTVRKPNRAAILVEAGADGRGELVLRLE